MAIYLYFRMIKLEQHSKIVRDCFCSGTVEFWYALVPSAKKLRFSAGFSLDWMEELQKQKIMQMFPTTANCGFIPMHLLRNIHSSSYGVLSTRYCTLNPFHTFFTTLLCTLCLLLAFSEQRSLCYQYNNRCWSCVLSTSHIHIFCCPRHYYIDFLHMWPSNILWYRKWSPVKTCRRGGLCQCCFFSPLGVINSEVQVFTTTEEQIPKKLLCTIR